MEGLHILANFYDCQYDLNKEKELFEQCVQFCIEAGLTVVGKTSYHFEPHGLTFAILLAESHVSIHTWPENGNVAFDIYTCNYQSDNNEKARYVYESLKKLLQPTHEDNKFVSRTTLN